MKWDEQKVLVTGGASFIGSHLVDRLLSAGSHVIIADDFSSGRFKNLEYPLKRIGRLWATKNLRVLRGDLKRKDFARSAMKDIDVVFHLAAAHGGRGYIQTHPVECCTNMALDQTVFEEAHNAGVERICFASSACVYPSYLQEEAGSTYLLKEEDADPFVRDKAFADLEYGWAKLMAEMTLRAYHRQYGMKTASVRIFTAYGPRENETHAVIALIAKALIHQDPYIIWGTGEQDRNFTYVSDITNALVHAAMRIEDGSPINAGRDDRITINKASELVFNIIGWKPKVIRHDLTMPQGVASRAADLSRSKEILEWEPKTSYREGFESTIKWYLANRNIKQLKLNLNKLLLER
jgi:UDP-glucose 4-epimerase